MGGSASTLLSPKKPRGTLGYLSESELSFFDQDTEVRKRSAEYAKKELFRSLPLNIKGLKPPRGGKAKAINPEMILSIDTRKYYQQAAANDSLGGPAAIERQIADLPDSVIIKPNGDMLVLYNAPASPTARKHSTPDAGPHRIDGLALLMLRDAPLAPAPPTLADATPSSLTVAWNLPGGRDPIGVIDQTEVQFRRAVRGFDNLASASLGFDDDGEPASPGGAASPLSSQVWRGLCKNSVLRGDRRQHTLGDLAPHSLFVFRARAHNPRGWSPWSAPSDTFATKAAPPDAPLAPVAVQMSAAHVHLHWRAPRRDNGAPVEARLARFPPRRARADRAPSRPNAARRLALVQFFSLRARRGASDDATWQTIYEGRGDQFAYTGLAPGECATFVVVAANRVGESPPSPPFSCKLPTAPEADDGEGLTPGAVVMDGAMWIECWDSVSESLFYFNKITGARQLEVPPELIEIRKQRALARAPGVETPEELANRFRLKRFRLLRDLHAGAHSESSNALSPARRASLSSGGGDALRFCITVRRERLLADSLAALAAAPMGELRKRLKVTFVGEEGIDSGGLTKDWYLQIGRELSRREAGIFVRTDAGELELNPEPLPPARRSRRLSARSGYSPAVVPRGSPGAPAAPATAGTPARIASAPALLVTAGAGAGASPPGRADDDDEERGAEYDDCGDDGFGRHRLVGRLMVKAIYDRQTLDLPLAGPIYKQLLAPDPMTSELSPRDLSPRDLSPRAVLGAGGADGAGGEEEEVSLDEVERLDAGFARSLRWILENDPAPLCETFSTTRRVLKRRAPREGDGARGGGGAVRVERLSADDLLALPPELRVVDEVVDLCEHGREREVTEANKHEYVRLMAGWRARYRCDAQIEALRVGLDLFGARRRLMRGAASRLGDSSGGSFGNGGGGGGAAEAQPPAAFSPAEFELLVNGRREIDVDEVRAYAIFQGGLDGEAPLALWLWQALREITPDERGRVLAFVTGSDRVPLDGYDPPFNVTLGSDMAKNSLPKSHTCFNQIVLPQYSSYEALKEKLLFAVENTDGFGMA